MDIKNNNFYISKPLRIAYSVFCLGHDADYTSISREVKLYIWNFQY